MRSIAEHVKVFFFVLILASPIQAQSMVPVLFYRTHGVPVARGPAFRAAFLEDGIHLQIGNSGISIVPVGSVSQPLLVDRQAGTLNDFRGRQTDWESGTPLYGAVEYPRVYPQIDMRWTGQAHALKSEFLVHPGGVPTAIRLRYDGVRGLKIGGDGCLMLETDSGTLQEHAPVAYQESGGVRKSVAVRYLITAEREIGFEVGGYDPNALLYIDPLLSYSSYFGGSGTDVATAVTADSGGNMYIAGYTDSIDLPLSAALQPSFGKSVDAFVAKFNAAGTQLIYATYLGGSMDDRATGLAVDASGNAIVVGYTTSANFPLAYPTQRTLLGSRDAFVAKINAAGTALVFSTLLGGSNVDTANAVATDNSGSIYITGETKSADFPVVSAYQATSKGLTDAFVTKLSAAGARIYSTYIGGAGDDRALSIAVDAIGAAYIGGNTTSPDFPTANAVQTANAGGQDGFVAKLGAGGNSLVFSTYFGGSGGLTGNAESVNAVRVDSALNVYFAGTTPSKNLPLLNAFQTGVAGGGQDAFVAALSASGKPLLFSTYLGGLGIDIATALSIDPAGFLYVAGSTTSVDFPVPGAIQPAKGTATDAFLVQISTTGPSVVFGTYLGGSGMDGANALAFSNGFVYVAGQTTSTDFPRNGAYQNYGYTEGSAFLAKYSFNGNPANGGVSPSNSTSATQTFTFTYSHGSGYTSLSTVWGLLQNGTNSANACMWQYNVVKNQLSLLDDKAATYLGPITPASGATLQNSQCTIGGPGTTVSGSGNTLTVVLPVVATSYFNGTKNIYLYAKDVYGKQVGWDLKGTWTLPVSGSPSLGNVSPASGSGTSGSFTFPFKHSAGYAQLTSVYALFAPSTSTLASTCMWKYTQSNNSLYLMNDAGSAYLGPISASSTSTLQNSQCTIGGAGTSVSGATDTLSVTLPITFTSSFGGTKNVYLYESDALGQAAGWTAKGSWTVPGASMPSVVSVTPSSGSGSSGSFSFTFKDAAGYARFNNVYALFQSNTNVASGCLWRYNLASGNVWLLNDAASSYGTPIIAGTSGTLQNSQCSISTASIAVAAYSDTLIVNITIVFKPAFGGVKNIYLDATDLSGQDTGFYSKGTWTVPGGSTPSVDSVTPSTGSGSSTVFSYQFSDTGGATQLSGVFGLIASQISLPNSCMWKYTIANNSFYLLNDAGSAYLGPMLAGANSTLANSQCTISGILSSAAVSGNTLTVGISLSFQSGYTGAKNNYLYAQDVNTSSAGWTSKGTWTAP